MVVVCFVCIQSVLEKIDAQDYNGAILSMGGNVDSKESIINLISKQINNEIKRYEMKIENLKRLELSENEKEKKEKEYREKLEIHESRKLELTEKIQKVSEHECIICIDKLDNPIMVQCCKNFYCSECILEWLKMNFNCPACRTGLQQTDLVKIDLSGKVKVKEKELENTKLQKILEIVESKKESDKILIFSNHDASFNEIVDKFKQDNINFMRLYQYSSLLEKFKSGKVPILLLNSMKCGAGIELTEATHIILYHYLDPSLETQVIGRAQRMGRTEPLTVYKFLDV